MNKLYGTLLTALLLAALSVAAADSPSKSRALVRTGVSFRTSDADLQRLYDAAEAKAAANIVQFTPSMKVLVEGGGYPNAGSRRSRWAARCTPSATSQVALNNQVVFMLGQREDGRLPGMVISGDTVAQRGWDKKPPEGYVWMPEHDIAADFEMFQGYCFPEPAWRMYFWIGKDKRLPADSSTRRSKRTTPTSGARAIPTATACWKRGACGTPARTTARG